MLDRKVGPKRNSLGEIRLQQPTSETLDSGCVYHVMSQEDCKVTVGIWVPGLFGSGL